MNVMKKNGLQYKLEEMSTFEGFIFYPTLPDPVEKVVRIATKEGINAAMRNFY